MTIFVRASCINGRCVNRIPRIYEENGFIQRGELAVKDRRRKLMMNWRREVLRAYRRCRDRVPVRMRLVSRIRVYHCGGKHAIS